MTAHKHRSLGTSTDMMPVATMKPVGPTRAALYVRVSTEKQAEFGVSLDAQTAELNRYCRDRGWAVVETYVDSGFSAKDTERPAYQRMIRDIQQGTINAIVCTKLDRLTRSVRNLCEINDDILKSLGVHLVCVRDGIDTSSVSGGLIMHLLALIGQIERENTAVRVAAAISHIRDSGGHYGKVPFGKMTVPHPTQPNMKQLVDCPKNGPWLAKITEWYGEGKQPTEIARLLNENGVKPYYSDKWTLWNVDSLLRSYNIHKARSAKAIYTYNREKAYRLALAMRQDGAKLSAIAERLSHEGLRPKNAQRYTASSVADLLRGSIFYNTNTAQGLALHLKETGHSLRDICDLLLQKGFTAPRGGRWYPKTLSELMRREPQTTNGSRRDGSQA